MRTSRVRIMLLAIICTWSFASILYLWKRVAEKDSVKRRAIRDMFRYPQFTADPSDTSKKPKMNKPRRHSIDYGREDLEVEGVRDYVFWYENFHTKTTLPLIARQQVCKKPVQNIAFLKTHFTGSDVLTNILNRYGDLNNLNVALPSDGLSTFYWPMRFQWKYIDITLLNGSLPDIIANHARYNNDVMDNILNPGSVYLTILRDPVTQLETTFNNLGFGGLLQVTDAEDQLLKFLKDPKYYIQGVIRRKRFKDTLNLIKNGQFFDLGLSTTEYHKKNIIKTSIQEMYEKFSLVLIYEHLDESLVLMKRRLCWQLDDVVYLKLHHENQNMWNRKTVSPELREAIGQWNKADTSLYEFFNRTLWEEIRFEGDSFWRELKEFRSKLAHLERDCLGGADDKDAFTLKEIPSKPNPHRFQLDLYDGDTLSTGTSGGRKPVKQLKHLLVQFYNVSENNNKSEEGSGFVEETKTTTTSSLNRRATSWNSYFCNKLLTNELDYLDYFRKKHANSKNHNF